MNRSVFTWVLLATAVYLGQVSAQDGPESVTRGTKQFRKSVLVSGLAGPWELTWGPDNMLWVTERTGKRVTRIDPATGNRSVAITISGGLRPWRSGRAARYGAAPRIAARHRPGLRLCRLYLRGRNNAARTQPCAIRRAPTGTSMARSCASPTQKPSGTLSDPVDLIAGLPVSNDHVSGRLKIGPDKKLFYTIGDEGHNQLGNFCLPIEAQRLPTRQEIDSKNYAAYVGKSIRLNLDGSIPSDNPKLAGIVSHVYTYGHRNMQGIDFAPDGTLYASEQGPKTDDEVNILKPGANYGWPHVAGVRDGKAYEYARWAESTTPCAELSFSDLAIPPSVPREPESAFTKPFVEPIATMFTVPSELQLSRSGLQRRRLHLLANRRRLQHRILFVPGEGHSRLGQGSADYHAETRLAVRPAADSRTDNRAAGHMSRYFQSENRYRDTAVSPDGKTIYIATDPGGLAEALAGGATRRMQNPGAILAFTYEGEGDATGSEPATQVTTNQPRSDRPNCSEPGSLFW